MITCYFVSIWSNITIKASFCFLVPELYIIGSSNWSQGIATILLKENGCLTKLICIFYVFIEIYHINISLLNCVGYDQSSFQTGTTLTNPHYAIWSLIAATYDLLEESKSSTSSIRGHVHICSACTIQAKESNLSKYQPWRYVIFHRDLFDHHL
jgi:hypothetical protein